MARTTQVLGFSVPPEVAEEYERLAKREGRSKSELFREMIATYKAKREEEARKPKEEPASAEDAKTPKKQRTRKKKSA